MPDDIDTEKIGDQPTGQEIAGLTEVDQNIESEKKSLISKIRDKLNKAIGQPILRHLERFQNWEKGKIEASKSRQKVKELLESDGYQNFDKWLLTYGSIFGPDIAKYLAVKVGENPNDGFLRNCFLGTSLGFGAGFIADTALNTYANGSSYWFQTRQDEFDNEEGERRLEWQPAPVLNLAGLAGVASDFVLDSKVESENLRLARLARIGRVGKVLRSAKKFDTKNSIEDESVDRIADDYTRRTTVLLASTLGLTVNSVPINLASMAVAAHSIKSFKKDVRVDIREVIMTKLNRVKEDLMKRVKANPLIQHFATYVDRNKNEVGQLGDHMYEAVQATEELANPQKEDFTLDAEGKLSPKFIDGTTGIVDIRNSSAIDNKYGLEKTLPAKNECFSELLELIERHGQFSNFTGDGAVFYFKDDKDEEDVIIKPKQDKAVEFALDLAPFSEKWDKELCERFPLKNEKENNHKITMGINSGPIAIADVFSSRTDEHGRKVQIRKAETVGNTVNTTARVESTNKQFPGHIILMTEDDYNMLSDKYKKLCRHCGESDMKGIGEEGEMTQIWGLPEDFDINLLEEE